MKIAILSDSHNTWRNLQKAIAKAHELDCVILLHAGDIATPEGVFYLSQFSGEVYFVLGNNDKDREGFEGESKKYHNIHYSGDTYEGMFDGVSVYMNHFPSAVRPVAKTGRYDLCIYGHEHTFAEKQYDKTLYVKPGALVGDKDGKVGFAVFDTRASALEHIFL